MKTTALRDFLVETTGRSEALVEDRNAVLMANGFIQRGSPGRYGGAVLTETDAVNATLAVVLDHKHKECPAENVRRLRVTEMSLALFNPGEADPLLKSGRAAFAFVRDLTIYPMADLGTVLDRVVAVLRSGKFASWCTGAEGYASLDIHDGRSATLHVMRGCDSAVFQFGQRPAEKGYVERIDRIGFPLLQELAKALDKD